MKYIITRSINGLYTHVWKVVGENKRDYNVVYVGREFPFYCKLNKREYSSISNFPKSLVVGSIKMVEYE